MQARSHAIYAWLLVTPSAPYSPIPSSRLPITLDAPSRSRRRYRQEASLAVKLRGNASSCWLPAPPALKLWSQARNPPVDPYPKETPAGFSLGHSNFGRICVINSCLQLQVPGSHDPLPCIIQP